MQTEVTNAQYKACVSDGICRKPETSHWHPNSENTDWYSKSQSGDAVTRVNWNDAVDYARWFGCKWNKNVALPTEAQWKKAAVGSDAGTNGASGMINGKVAEWTLDWDDPGYYDDARSKSVRTGFRRSDVVHGRWPSFDESLVHAANRGYSRPTDAKPDVGFRLVLMPTEEAGVSGVHVVRWNSNGEGRRPRQTIHHLFIQLGDLFNLLTVCNAEVDSHLLRSQFTRTVIEMRQSPRTKPQSPQTAAYQVRRLVSVHRSGIDEWRDCVDLELDSSA